MLSHNPAWPSWSSANALLAKLCLYRVPPPLEALAGVKNEDDFWTRFWSFPPTVGRV